MMKRLVGAGLFALFLSVAPTLLPQTQPRGQNPRDHVITVGGNGTVFAKPDVGILAMTIRSSAPIAEEAVAENGRKAERVEKALAAHGYAPKGYKITSVVIGEAGGPRFGPGQPGFTVYEATQYVYVFFEGADLSDVAQLTVKSVAVIEGLRKAGAVPASLTGVRIPQAQGGLIIYAIKDSHEYERQALQQALGRARDAAEEIAKGMQVHITGVRNVGTGGLAGNYMPRSDLPYLEGLPYRFYSTKSDGVEISANVTVDYDFK